MTGTPERSDAGAERLEGGEERPARRGDERPAGRGERPAHHRRQIEFPRLQTHSKAFEAAMVGLSFLCVIIVLFIVLGTDMGTTTRP